jgi:ABC-type amino acid transport substrate-binding protein
MRIQVLAFCALLLCVTAEVVVNFHQGGGCVKPADPSNPTEKFTGAQIGTIQARGFLNCATPNNLPNFAVITEGTSTGTGLYPDLCRALTAAMFPDFPANPNRLKFTASDVNIRFTLHTKGVDVVMADTTKNALRMIELPIFFGPVILVDGAVIAAKTASGITAANVGTITGKKICFGASTTSNVVTTLYPNFTPAPFATDVLAVDAFKAGQCDAIASDKGFLQAAGLFADVNVIIVVTFSREPLAPFTFQLDEEIFVETVVNGLIAAYERGYARANATAGQATMIYPPSVGQGLNLVPDFMRNAIAAVGNMDEILNRWLPPASRQLSDLPSKGGVFYAFP